MKYYSVLKREELLIHAMTWMNHEDIILSQRNEVQKATYFMISLIRNT